MHSFQRPVASQESLGWSNRVNRANVWFFCSRPSAGTTSVPKCEPRGQHLPRIIHSLGSFAWYVCLSQIVSLTPAPWSLLFLFLEQPWFYHKRPLILSLLNLTKACNVVSRWCITLGSRKSSVLHHGPSTLRLTLRNSLRNLCQEPLREYNPGTLDWICLHRDSLAQVPPNHAFPNLLVVP